LPITPAHAAAAWPLSRALPALPLSALIIGAFSPDFEYLLRLSVHSRIAHSMTGLVVFCVPVSLIVWAAYERVVRPALTELLPPGLAASLRPRHTPIGLVIVAVALGAATHLVWDGMTHRTGWLAEWFPSMLQEVSPGLRRYRLLQHVSSGAGALAIAIWIGGWLRRQPREARRFAPGQRARAWLVTVAVLSLAAIGGIANAMKEFTRTQADWWALFAAGAMAAFVVILFVFGLVTRARPVFRSV
jgi:hypothetical protein